MSLGEDGCVHRKRAVVERTRPMRKTWRTPFQKAADDADPNNPNNATDQVDQTDQNAQDAANAAADAAELPPQQFNWLHHIADESRQQVIDNFLEAVKKAKSGIGREALIAAVEAGDTEAVIKALSLDRDLEASLKPLLTEPLENVFIAAGRMAPGMTVPSGARISMRFDLTNPHALDFIRDYDFGLIREVSQETRDAVRLVVRDAFETGGHPTEQARRIVDFIGLTKKQAQAVLNYRDALEMEERPAEQVARMVEKYRLKMLKLRATNIARTETIRAANAAQQVAWKQAIDNRHLDAGTARQQWLVTPDDRLCILCEAVPDLNPGGVRIGEPFITPLGPILYPPLHPQCRCVANLIAF